MRTRKNRKSFKKYKGGNEKNRLIMIITNGLGNRIFQILAGLGFAEKWNMNLFIFSSDGDHISQEESKKNIIQLFPTIQFVDSIDETYFKISEAQQFIYTEFENPNKNTVISGYFQNEKYFPKEKQNLNLIEPINNILKNIENVFFIHFRFGDYEQNGFKLNLDNYYKNCIKKIKEEHSNITFLIVSNDIQKSKEYIKNVLTIIDTNIIYDTSTNRLDSLYYMSISKGGICSNSTFSWFGAYSINESKYIYMPKPWLSWLTEQQLSDMYPRWTNVIDINELIGGNNQNKKLIIKNGFTQGGLFSEFIKMLGYLEDNPTITEIEYNILSTPPGRGLPFIKEGEELFSKLFESYNENKNIDEIIIAQDFKYNQYTYKDAFNNYNENHHKLQGLHNAFEKYIKIKPEILTKVNDIYNKIKEDCDILVGVFVRSNALANEQPNGKMPTRDEYIRAINKLDKSKKIKYFLRIDNDDDLQFYKDKLQPNYFTEMKRSNNSKLNSLHVSGNEYMSLEDLENILIDILLLSKCDISVHCVSNMATASLAINMNQQSICITHTLEKNGGNIELTISNNISQSSGFSSLLNQYITFLVDNPTVSKVNYNIRSFGLGNPMAYITEGEELFSKLFEPYDEKLNIDESINNDRYLDQRITGINAYNYYNENRNKLQPFHDAYKKYIKIKKEVQNKIDEKVKLLKDNSEQIIGIFIRGSALAGEQPSNRMPTKDEYDNAVSKIDKSKKTKYFFCIDNVQDLEYFKNKYTPNFYTNIRRSNNIDNSEPHKQSIGTLDDLYDSFIEIILLSSCNILVHCVSNMATASLYINMEQQSIYPIISSGGNKDIAYVINLNKRPEKWERMQNDFKNTDIQLERFSAIEHENGHIGCGKSFQALITMAKEKNMDSILILEDDCKLLKNFTSRWEKIKKWLDTNKDKWNIFNGGVRYPLSPNFKYGIDPINKLYTTKGGNYTHFMYINKNGYDAILNWDHSKYGLFDYYINSYELGNFLYVDPPIALQYSGYSNTNKGEKNYNSNGWVFTKKKETNALPNNNKKGGNKGKRRTYKKGGNKGKRRTYKKGGNKEIPFIFVHIGEDFFPDFMNYTFKQCKLWNPTNIIYFICSNVHLSKFDNSLVKHIDINSLIKSKKHEQYNIEVPVDNTFRNGFYRFSTERIFILEDFCIQHSINEFLHLENDNMVYFSANELLDILRNSVNGLSAPVLTQTEISFGILYCNKIDILSQLSEYLLDKKSGSQRFNGDMIYGGEFFLNNKNTSYLPSIPIINNIDETSKNKIANNIEKYNGIFDPAQYGVWLGGTDKRNGGGEPPYTSINNNNIITPDKFIYELCKESNNLQRYHIINKNKNIDLPIYNLHIHSKKLEEFYFDKQNGGNK